jgi:DNA modification methylase
MPQIELLHTDCMEYMATLPDKAFDVIISDPPYGLNGEFRFLADFFKEAARVSRMQVYIMDWRYPLRETDGKFAELVWEYGWVSGGRTKSQHFYPTHNTIHFCGDRSFRFSTKDGSIIKRAPGFSSPRQCSYAKKSGHPHEKPIALMKYLVERTSGPVFDPFMGSGSTGVACAELGRDFVGTEQARKWYDVARHRLAAHQSAPRLFPATPSGLPKQLELGDDVLSDGT